MKLVQKALLGRKLGMTQLFTEDGRAVPVTVIAAGPCVVLQRRDLSDGAALQLGYEDDPKGARLNKPETGHLRRAADQAGVEIAPCRHLAEFRFRQESAGNVGDRVSVDIFTPGERVDVTGISKGKGFAGVHKRHGFHGGPASHGSMSHRRPASGGATDAARVFKGTKKPGHLGNVRRTVKRLRVQAVHPDDNLLVVEGSVPGPAGRLVSIWQPAGAAAYAAPAAESDS